MLVEMGVRRLEHTAGDPSRRGVSAAVVAVGVYLAFVVARIPEMIPILRVGLIAGLVALALALALPPMRPPLFRRAEVRAACGIVILGAMTIPFSFWPGGSFDTVVNIYTRVIGLFLLVAYTLRSLRDIKVVFRAILVGIFLLELLSLAQSPATRSQWEGSYDPNDLAFIMSCFIPLASGWALCRRGLERCLAVAIVPLAVAVAIKTQSRGGFITLTTVAIFVCLRLLRQTFVTRIAVLVGLVLLLVAFGPVGYWDRIGTMWGADPSSQSEKAVYDATGLWGARWDEWMNGLTLMLSHPVLGVGAGVYTVGEGALHGGAGKWSAAHNAYLEIGAELGVGGLGLFLVFLGLGVRNCRRVQRSQDYNASTWEMKRLAGAVEGSLYGYGVAAVSLSIEYFYLLYLLVAISLVLARLTDIAILPSTRESAKRSERSCPDI